MKPRRRAALVRIIVLVLITALTTAYATGCSTHDTRAQPPSPPSAQPTTGSTATAPLWIVAGSTLTRLLATDSAEATADFDTPNAFVLTSARSWSIPPGWTSTPTADFTSYAALRSELARGNLDPRFKAVLYDNEQWSLTPATEQHNPGHYYQLAADLVHRHHLLFIAAPATNLVNVLTPTAAATQGHYQAFLALALPGDVARNADILDVQAQGAEADTALFASFVAQAAAQARSANPDVRVLAGLSTNPSGKSVTSKVIETAARAVRSDVDGYWLNDPAASTACPRCAGPFPQTALATVHDLTRPQGTTS